MRFQAMAFVALCAAPLGAQTIDIQDYFILTPDSFWHYTGEGQPGSSIDDDFSWEVLDTMIDVGGGVMATQIETFSDEQTDFRHLDRDFWRLDPSGDLFLHGFRNGTADTGFPIQDVIFDEPFLMGTDGMSLGAVFTDEVTADVTSSFGSSATLQLTVTHNAILPSVDTPLGTFLDCLQVIIEVSVVSVEGGIGTIPVNLDVITSEFILKEGVGMVMHDQNADPNDAEIQAIDAGMVGGVPIVADIPPGEATPLELLLENLLMDLGFNLELDLNVDGVLDAADVVTAVNASNEAM